MMLRAPMDRNAAVDIEPEQEEEGSPYVDSEVTAFATMTRRAALGYIATGVNFGAGMPPPEIHRRPGRVWRGRVGENRFFSVAAAATPQPWLGSQDRSLLASNSAWSCYLDVQKKWQEADVFSGGREHIRPAVAWQAAGDYFAPEFRVETSSPS